MFAPGLRPSLLCYHPAPVWLQSQPVPVPEDEFCRFVRKMANEPCDREEAVHQLRTVRDFLRWAVSRFEAAGVFYGHGTDNAWDEAVALVFGTLHLPWDINPAVLPARLTEDERVQLSERVARRVDDRVPVPYLTGEAWFAGLPFYVDTNVLIPRSPIAELFDGGLSPWLDHGRVRRALDLCCGSGCIGIAAAHAFAEAAVDLADLSEPALAIARKNIGRHDCGDRVQALQGDLFGAVSGRRYDLILANPPYVDARDLADMPAEFMHEPRLALQAGEDGLDIARRILAEAADFLSPGGILVLEVGNSAEALAAAFPEMAFLWLELEQGGHGVCLLERDQLIAHAGASSPPEA